MLSTLRLTGMVLLGLTAIVTLASIYAGPQFWGMNLLSYFDSSLRTVMILLLALAGVSLVFYRTNPQTKKARRDSSKSSKAQAQESNERARSTSSIIDTLFEWPALLALLFAGVCFAFPLEWSLLGDGSLFIGYNYRFGKTGKLVLLPREFLSALIVQGLDKLLVEIYGRRVDSMLSFQIIGAIAAYFWCFLSVKLVRFLVNEHHSGAQWLRLLALVLLLSCGGTLFFFAYVEVYPLAYTATLGVIYAGFRYWRKEWSSAPLIGMLALAMLLHMQNVLLLPGILFLVAKQRKPEFDVNRKWMIGAVGALLAFYIYTQVTIQTDITAASNPFIPFSSTDDMSYTLLSSQHLLDIVNEHLLLAPIALVLLIALLLRKPDFKAVEIRFITISLLFFEAFLIGGNLVFGLARDWDAAAMIGPLLVLLVILLLQRVSLDANAMRRLSYALSFSSILFLVQWLTVNHNFAASLTRYKALLETYRPLIAKANTHYGYEHVRKVLKYFPPSQELYVILEMMKLQPWPVTTSRMVEIMIERVDQIDRLGYQQIYKIRDSIMAMSDSVLLIEEVGEEKVRANEKHSANVLNHADIFNFIVGFEAKITDRDSSKAYAFARAFMRRHPALPQGYELLAELKLEFNDKNDSLITALTNKAISLHPNRPRPYLFLATIQSENKEYEAARRNLRKILSLDPSWINATKMFAHFVRMAPPEHRYKADIEMIEASCKRIIERARESRSAVKDLDKQIQPILTSMEALRPLAN